jgi:hypothetical protein
VLKLVAFLLRSLAEADVLDLLVYLELNAWLRGWLHERFRVRYHVRFAANRRCDLLYLRFGVAFGIATVYTYA